MRDSAGVIRSILLEKSIKPTGNPHKIHKQIQINLYINILSTKGNYLNTFLFKKICEKTTKSVDVCSLGYSRMNTVTLFLLGRTPSLH